MNQNIMIPENVSQILQILSSNQKEGFIVGGCVRDALLGRMPHDYDITTNAKPDEVITLFEKLGYPVIPTGIKHGTVTVLINGEGYEITTYRTDGKYSDGRHPDTVQFSKTLNEDLMRRDFTINAMAYNPDIGLIDPYNGKKDLEAKIIRCVGSAKDRFQEDALRILRSWRFSCQLDFKIDKDTMDAAILMQNNLINISKERIQSEFMKAIQSEPKIFVKHTNDILNWIIPVWKELDIQQNNPYHVYNVKKHTLKAYESLSNNTDNIVRLSVFLHDIGKPYTITTDVNGINHFYGHPDVSAKLVENIMNDLKFDNNTKTKVKELVLYHDIEIPLAEKNVSRLLHKIGDEQFLRLLQVKEADIHGQNPQMISERISDINRIKEIYNNIKEKALCFNMKDLAINGSDLIGIGYKPGKEIGITLNYLLNNVIDNNIPNDPEILTEIANIVLPIIVEHKPLPNIQVIEPNAMEHENDIYDEELEYNE